MLAKRLIDYYPPVIAPYREYRIAANAEQPEIDALSAGVERAMINQFVLTADIYGIRRWEDMLKIVPLANQSLDDRRLIILLRLSEQRPFTMRVLKQMLALLCGDDGYSVELYHNDYAIKVIVEERAVGGLRATADMLERVVPANLIIDLILLLRARFVTLQRFKLSNLRIHARFRRGGDDTIRLDGQRQLDGTWRLSQRSWESGYDLLHMGIGLRAQAHARLATTITKDWGWRLDGAQKLDGSQKLSSGLTTEEV